MVEAIFYIIFCVLTGLCGAYRRMGFFGTFLIAVFVTPVVVLLVLLILVRHEMQGSLPRLVIMSGLAGVSNAALLAAINAASQGASEGKPSL